MTGRAITPLAVLLVAVAACSDDPVSAPAVTEVETTTTAQPPPATAPSATEVPPTEPVESSAPPTTEPPVECDQTVMLKAANQALRRARLTPGGKWDEATEDSAFVARTNTAEEFAHRVGSFDCALRMSQTTSDGAERMLVGAWVGDRLMYAIQATDTPSEPYAQEQNFQLMIEQAYGEWLREGFEWAGTMEGGESIVVGAVDGPIGLAAKAWPSAVPRFEDIPVSLPVEEYAIDVLTGAGARNVSLGEPGSVDWQIAAVQHATPAGLHLIATVAAPEWFAADAELFPGEMTVEEVGGVDVNVTRGAPDAYAVGSVGWACGDHVWYIDSIYGTVEELVDWTAEIIDVGDCAP